MPKKLTGRALAKFEAERNIWQEVLDGVREIKRGGGKRVVVEPRSPIMRARLKAGLTQAEFAVLILIQASSAARCSGKVAVL